MKLQRLAALALAGAPFLANAESVAFSENFDSDYSDNFPTVITGHDGMPAYAIQSLFIGLDGAFESWWHLKDSSSSTDRYMASHSYYYEPAQSNSWLCSRAISIPTEGFVLTFGAQSYELGRFDYGQGLSDLWVYVLEELPTKANLPSGDEATLYIQQLPVGRSDADMASDFTYYSLDMDPWAGKEVYLCFANLNYNKDILAIDDVKIARADRAELEVEHPESLIVDDTYTVVATISALQDLNEWTLTFDDGTVTTSNSGDSLSAGEEVSFTFEQSIKVGATVDYRLTLVADAQDDIVSTGSVTRLSFAPYRRVFIEEITGQWCGNCPIGMYNVECMLEDEEMGQYVVPVAVHVIGTGYEYMVCSEYANALGVTSAPMFRINREARYIGVGVHDYLFDPTDELSLAYQVVQWHNTPTFFDISIDGSLNDAGDAFDMVATVTAAMPISDNRYSVGWVLTENNVDGGESKWYQSNYYSGTDIEGNLGGWTLLDEYVSGIKWHDVARGVWNIAGQDPMLPESLEMDRPYTVEQTLSIPEVSVGEINPDNCMVIAYVVDSEEMEIMNVAWMPMSDVAQDRFTIADFLDVSDVYVDDAEATVEYYNLQGMRITAPQGCCIERRGGSSRVVIVK